VTHHQKGNNQEEVENNHVFCWRLLVDLRGIKQEQARVREKSVRYRGCRVERSARFQGHAGTEQ
jgi:hypothetical protein